MKYKFLCWVCFLTKVTPRDFRRWRATDFAVKSSITSLNYFQNIQLASEERIIGWDDSEFAARSHFL